MPEKCANCIWSLDTVCTDRTQLNITSEHTYVTVACSLAMQLHMPLITKSMTDQNRYFFEDTG